MEREIEKTSSPVTKGNNCTSVYTEDINKKLSVAPNNEEKEKILICGDCADFPILLVPIIRLIDMIGGIK